MTSEKNRGILFIIFTVLFVILTITISLYASGYKLNLTYPIKMTSLLQKTGNIIIASNPSGATITIESKDSKIIKTLEEKTSTKIQRLFPGEYFIKLELDGYWTFEKEIEVFPKKTTYLEDITLFKNSLPLKILDSKMQDLVISPNKKYIILPEDNVVINLKTEEKIILPKENLDNVSWSKNSKYILTDKYIFNMDNHKNVIYIEKLIGNNIEKIKYSSDADKVYYIYNNQINYFEISSRTNRKIITKYGILDYLVTDEYIYIISENEEITLDIYSLETNKLEKEFKLPDSKEYKLENVNEGYIDVIDKEHDNILIINKLEIEKRINNIKQYIRINKNEILYTNDFEIYTFNIKEDDLELITRISDPIKGIHLDSRSGYIIYSTENRINIIESDKEGSIRTTRLTELNKILKISFIEKSDTIYFVAQIGNQRGLYKLFIQ